jgi:hypothetical protein
MEIIVPIGMFLTEEFITMEDSLNINFDPAVIEKNIIRLIN